jgi:hypothetical protein
MTEFTSERDGAFDTDLGDLDSLWAADIGESEPVAGAEPSLAQPASEVGGKSMAAPIASHAFDSAPAEWDESIWAVTSTGQAAQAAQAAHLDQVDHLDQAASIPSTPDPRESELVFAGATAGLAVVSHEPQAPVMSPVSTNLWSGSSFDGWNPAQLPNQLPSYQTTQNSNHVASHNAGHDPNQSGSTSTGNDLFSPWSTEQSDSGWNTAGATAGGWGDTSATSVAGTLGGPTGRSAAGQNNTTILSHAAAETASSNAWPPSADSNLVAAMAKATKDPSGEAHGKSNGSTSAQAQHPEFVEERRGPRPLVIAASVIVAGLIATMLWTILGSNTSNAPMPTLLPSTPAPTPTADPAVAPSTTPAAAAAGTDTGVENGAVVPTDVNTEVAPTTAITPADAGTDPMFGESGSSDDIVFSDPIVDAPVAAQGTPAAATASSEGEPTVQVVPDGAPAPAP